METIRAAHEEAPTGELVTAVVGDRCPNCQSPLASDQRYCVRCGERRGKARFSFSAMATQADPGLAPAPAKQKQHPRASSGATLVAGVGTLLLAMGVGVLIGHNNNTPKQAAAAAPQIITVGGGAAGGAVAATPATAATHRGKVTPVKNSKVKITPKTQKAAVAAASKVLGAGAPKNATVKQGGACSGGPGCQNGSFTGNFFH